MLMTAHFAFRSHHLERILAFFVREVIGSEISGEIPGTRVVGPDYRCVPEHRQILPDGVFCLRLRDPLGLNCLPDRLPRA